MAQNARVKPADGSRTVRGGGVRGGAGDIEDRFANAGAYAPGKNLHIEELGTHPLRTARRLLSNAAGAVKRIVNPEPDTSKIDAEIANRKLINAGKRYARSAKGRAQLGY